MGQVTTVNRWFYRCRDCLAVVAIDSETPLRPYWHVPQATCAACKGDMELMGRVSRDHAALVKDEERCACDARCTHAMGPNCDCKCGGENHGTGKVVEVVVVVGGVPVISVEATADLLRIATQWRQAIALVEAAKTAISDKPKFDSVDYTKMRILKDAVHRARLLRTHDSRMNCLIQGLQQARGAV